MLIPGGALIRKEDCHQPSTRQRATAPTLAPLSVILSQAHTLISAVIASEFKPGVKARLTCGFCGKAES